MSTLTKFLNGYLSDAREAIQCSQNPAYESVRLVKGLVRAGEAPEDAIRRVMALVDE